MRSMSDEEMKLREFMFEMGEKHPKKHGHWIIFRFRGEGTFLEMDSWNGALHYKVGSGEYNYWTG